MKVKFYLAMAAAAFLMTNCSQDENLIQTKGSTNTLTAAIESASRSTVTDGGIFAWADGDAIAVGNAEGSYTKFEYRNGTFTAQTAIVPTGYAIYPYNGAYTELPGGTTLPGITLPGEYDYGSTNAPMLATISGNNNQLTFNHLAGLMRFRVKDIPDTETEFSLIADKSITGSFTPEADNEGKTCIKAGTGDTNKEVKITFTSVEDVMDFYVPMPVGEYTSLTVKIGDKELASTNGVTNTISRGKLLLMPTMVFEDGDLKLEGGSDNNVNVSLNANEEVSLEVSDGEEVVVEMVDDATATLNLSAPEGSTEPLIISDGSVEGTASSQTSNGTLNVSATNASSLNINTPTLTVKLTSGTYNRVEALTAQQTLIIGEGVKIGELVLNGGNVKLEGDLELTSSLEIKNGITTTIDLNGYTMSQEKECTESYQMISNKGNLTIKGKGKISFKDTGSGDPSFGWGSYTIRNEGTLVVEDATIEHLGEQNQGSVKHMYCAIFQYSGSTTINDGTISTPTYRSVRLWKGDMTINDGNFEGQVWVQSVDDSAELNINGGTFAPRGVDGSSVFIGNKTESNVVHNVKFNVTGGTFTTKVGFNDQSAIAGGISGGTFSDFSFLKLLAETSSIKIGAEITLNETATIPTGKTVTLDLNGKAISQTSDTPVSMITNNGNLTIKDSSNGSGKIDFTFNGTVNNNVAANVISNRGTLVVEGGEISNAGTGNQIGYAIDNYNGSTLTVNGGKITASGSSYYDGIRLFCGSNETTVTVNKGEISTIWAQNPTTDKATAVNGTVIINGGTVGTIYYENYTTVKVKTDVTATVTPYGTGQDNTTTITEGEYTVYSFVHSDTNE